MRIEPCSQEQPRGVNFIVFNKAGEVLVQKRSADAPTFPNRYCFPGGGIEEGETALEAVKREAYEEAAILLMNCEPKWDFFYIAGGKAYMNRIFVARLENETVTSGEGQMMWKTIEELETIHLVLGENIILPHLKSVRNAIAL